MIEEESSERMFTNLLYEKHDRMVKDLLKAMKALASKRRSFSCGTQTVHKTIKSAPKHIRIQNKKTEKP